MDTLPRAELVRRPASRLVDPTRQAAAAFLDSVQRPLFFGWNLAPVIAFWWLWRSGRAAAVRDWLARRMRNRWGLRFAYGAWIGGVAVLAAAPFHFASYRVGYVAGLTSQSSSSWFAGLGFGLLVAAGYTGAAVAVILWLVDRTHLWYLWATTIVVVAVILSAVVQPLVTLHATLPLERPSLASALQADFTRLEIRPPRIEVALARDGTFGRADVEGLGPTVRIVLGQAVVDAAGDPELGFLIAREAAYIARSDPTKLIVVATLLFILGLALAVVITDRIGFRRDDDPLSRLAAVAAVLGMLTFAIYPVYTAYSRNVERNADDAALAATRDPAAAVRAVVRLSDERFLTICPPGWERDYFLTQPPIADRIARFQGRPTDCP